MSAGNERKGTTEKVTFSDLTAQSYVTESRALPADIRVHVGTDTRNSNFLLTLSQMSKHMYRVIIKTAVMENSRGKSWHRVLLYVK